jgi:hypothetical protein
VLTGVGAHKRDGSSMRRGRCLQTKTLAGSASSALRSSRPPNGSRSPLTRASLALVHELGASPGRIHTRVRRASSARAISTLHADVPIRMTGLLMECVREGVRSSNYSAAQPSTHTHTHIRYSPRFTSACVTAQNTCNSDPTSCAPCTARMDGSHTATPGAGSVTQSPTLPAIPTPPHRHLRGPCEPFCECTHAFISTQHMACFRFPLSRGGLASRQKALSQSGAAA